MIDLLLLGKGAKLTIQISRPFVYVLSSNDFFLIFYIALFNNNKYKVKKNCA